MRAFVIHAPGSPDALQLELLPHSRPRAGWVQIEVAERNQPVRLVHGDALSIPFRGALVLEEQQAAHASMDSQRANGKVVGSHARARIPRGHRRTA